MDQHDVISELGAAVRKLLAEGDEPTARVQVAVLLSILRPHVTWEEDGLFARIVRQGDFADHVARLEADHEKLYAALEAAETGPRSWRIEILEMLDELDAHIYRENFGLFPAAIAVLDGPDWEAIAQSRPILRQSADLTASTE